MAKQYRPSMFKGAANRDDNEPKITALLDAYQIQYSKGKPGDGYDLSIHIQPMELWEIKNPQQPPAKRKLTEVETLKQEYCRRHGIPYRVIEYSDQAQEILARYNEREIA